MKLKFKQKKRRNWLNETTPEGAYLAADGGVDDSYDEDILYVVDDNSEANYVIE